MDEEKDNNLFLQEQELEILKSIFGETSAFSQIYNNNQNNNNFHFHSDDESEEECNSCNTTDDNNSDDELNKYNIKISIDLPNDYKILVNENDKLLNYSIVCLPKINLIFQYPIEYPMVRPILYLTSSWLKHEQMKRILDYLNSDEMWESEELVIFKFVDWIKTNTISFLGLQDGLLLDKEEIDLDSLSILDEYSNISWDHESEWTSTVSALPMLRSYNSHEGKSLFNNNQCYKCIICDDESKCTFLSNCSHYCCNDCMDSLININLESGDFGSIKCPYFGCNQPIELSIIEMYCKNPIYLLNYQDYLKRTKGLVKCTKCIDGWAYADQITKSTFCSNCFYSFCLLCREIFHPGLNCHEKPKIIHRKYLKSREIKRDMGVSAPVVTQVDVIRICPKCSSLISKIEGCNKVRCSMCSTFFCFICCKPNISYDHFGAECELFLAISQVKFVPRSKIEPVQHTVGRGPNRVGLLTGEDNEHEINPITASTLCKCKNVIYRFSNSNTIYCGRCKFNLCFLCKSVIKGTKHFMTTSCCQSGEPDSSIWKPDTTYRFYNKDNPPPNPQKLDLLQKQEKQKQLNTFGGINEEGVLIVRDVRNKKNIELR